MTLRDTGFHGPGTDLLVVGVVADCQMAAGSWVSLCQQVVNAVAQGQVRSIRSQWRRACSAMGIVNLSWRPWGWDDRRFC